MVADVLTCSLVEARLEYEHEHPEASDMELENAHIPRAVNIEDL